MTKIADPEYGERMAEIRTRHLKGCEHERCDVPEVLEAYDAALSRLSSVEAELARIVEAASEVADFAEGHVYSVESEWGCSEETKANHMSCKKLDAILLALKGGRDG